MYEIRLVCEGPTDVDVLRAILDSVLDDDYILDVHQPDISLYGGEAGPHGGGWKGVRGWCEAVRDAGGLTEVHAITRETDLLVIHVDADIAKDVEPSVAHPCPPVLDTVCAVSQAVLRWLGCDEIPAKVALWVPAMATESYLLRAFWPDDVMSAPCSTVHPDPLCVECLADPARALLQRRPRFVRMKSQKKGAKRLHKVRSTYRAQRATLSAAWPDVVQTCRSASLLEDRIAAVLGGPVSR